MWVLACDSPQYPELCGSIPEQTIVVGEVFTVDLCFDDPDGEMLAFEVFNSNPGVAGAAASGSTVTVTAISPGIALVTMVATDPTGLKAQQSFRVVVPNRPPVAVGRIEDREVMVGDSVVLDVAGYFSEPDGQALSYGAVVSDSSRAGVSVEGPAVTVLAVAKGTVEVTVSATDPGGLAAVQSFRVKVPNRPPMPVDSIASREIMVERADTFDVSAFFHDPDGDVLTYVAAVSDSAVAAVMVSGSALTVTGVAKGEAEVTVTATDDEGLSASHRFRVTVPNRPPVVTDTIGPRMLFSDEADTIDLTAHFSDPDGDALTWDAEASDSTVVALELSAIGGVLTVTPQSQGEAEVTVTATDIEGLAARQSFAVTVPNRAPVATDAIASQSLHKRETAELDLTRHFTDPDGDVLRYALASTNTLVATAAVEGTTLTVRAGAAGEATLAVTATDPGGLSARHAFTVTVLNRAPTITTPIPALTIFRGRPHTLDLSDHFTDPDGDTLAYTAKSSNRRAVRVETSGDTITLTVQFGGTADVTVTATDPDSATVRQTFAVTVGNQPPVARGRFPDLELGRGDRLTLSITGYFSDPDRDELTYAASTADTSVATATAYGTSVTLTGVSDGQTTLTLTATDPDSATATQTALITVAGQGGDTPEPTGQIPPQTVAEGASRTLVVSAYFEDPNGDPLTYDAATDDPNVATASTSGATVTITGVDAGQTTLTVTATDPGGRSTASSTKVTVVRQGQGPVTTGSIPAQAIEVGQTSTVSVANHFQDPDGGNLGFSASSSNPAIVTATTSGADITLAGIAEGRATVTVTATDPDGLSASQRIAVTVASRGQAPVVVGTLADLALEAGQNTVLDATSLFQDPEGETLTYQAGTTDPTVATASTTDASIIVRGVAAGTTTLTVTATDPGGLSATQSAAIDVSDRPSGPETVGTIPNDSIMVGDTILIDVAPYFSHPNGSPLTYAAGTAHSGIAAVDMRGSTARITGRGRGSVTLSIVATDPDHRTAVQRFILKVSRIDTGFTIDVGYHSVVSDATRAAVSQAVAQWQSILARTEFPDILFSNPVRCPTFRFILNLDLAEVDDIGLAVVETRADGSGGLLGYANLCAARTSGHTAVGIIVIDADDVASMEQDGNLEDLVTHEIGHVLGIGFGDAWHDLVVDTVGIPNFTGALATAAYDAAGGSSTSYPYPKVPLDFSASHWREVPFGDELMTPNLAYDAEEPLSAITIQALADIGYTVNVGLAEPYSLPSADIAVHVAGDRPAFDLTNDIERGPVLVIDNDGNIVRSIGEEAAAQLQGDRPVYRVTIGQGR